MPRKLEGYRQQIQLTENWCWAAIGVSFIAHGDFKPVPTQCEFAERVLGRPCHVRNGCPPQTPRFVICARGTRSPSDRTEALTREFSSGGSCNVRPASTRAVIDTLNGTYKMDVGAIGGPLPLAEIKRHLDKGWPVVIEREDANGISHLLVIRGINGERLHIDDPEGGCKTGVHHSQLHITDVNGRKGSFDWIATFYHN